MNAQSVIGLVTAAGTFTLAVASFMTIRRDSGRLKFEKQPNLVFHDVELYRPRPYGNLMPPKLRFTVTNLGLYPVVLVEVALEANDSGVLEESRMQVAVKPGELFNFDEEIQIGGTGREGRLMFFFQYGATGRKLHSLSIPIGHLREDDSMVFDSTSPTYTAGVQPVSEYWNELHKQVTK